MALPDTLLDRACSEIRQQMDGVLALAEQLSNLRLSGDAEACVGSMVDVSANVRRLVDRMLDLKAVEAGRLELDATPLKLQELADQLQAGCQARQGRSGPVLVSYDGPPEAAVLADRARLLQIFDALIAEASAHAPASAIEVTLRAAATDDGIRVHGAVRGATAPRDGVHYEGGLDVALGVLLSAKLVQGLRGTMSRQEISGCGDTVSFDVTLPSAEAPLAQMEAKDAPGPHVLVVDDNATNRVVAQALCDMLGCTSESADDGLEAVEAVAAGRFDIILMDIRMPNMDGVAATKAIRALGGEAGRTTIFALTANIDPDDVQSYLAAGMSGVIEKPVRADALREALRQAGVERSAARAA